MTNPIANRFTVLAFLVLSCASAATARADTARADEPPDIDIEEITRRVTEWRNSFVNVRVVWELRSLPESQEAVDEWPPPPDPESSALFMREEWIWADHGLDRLEVWAFFHPDGSSKGRSIYGFNGPKGVSFRAQFRKATQEEPEKYLDLMLRGLGSGRPTSYLDRAAMEGLYWPVTGQWLPELLSEWEWNLEAVENIAGEPCARIASVREDEIVLLLWLDLSHDCLVKRRRAWTDLPERPDFIVDEFQQLDGGIWFPKRGRLQLGGIPHENQIFVVTEAAVNESLDLAKFDPPTPAVGTSVDDHGRPYTYGASAKQGVSSNPAGQQATAVGASDRVSTSFSAVPPLSNWKLASYGLAGVAVISAALGFWFSRQKTGDRS